ncbi:putative proline-rich receptor-like protein kinase PERK13 [Iris pallida]|uniref:Proline-rich receptor-like protein kinase PERK13 n=1 Tax=Iris pallida TaxID=29817 RepID=A0AAX6EEG0_IRIPA|nr:putative proline-rich receptor-like protein kinase PERK13 [Iris pallida]
MRGSRGPPVRLRLSARARGSPERSSAERARTEADEEWGGRRERVTEGFHGQGLRHRACGVGSVDRAGAGSLGKEPLARVVLDDRRRPRCGACRRWTVVGLRWRTVAAEAEEKTARAVVHLVADPSSGDSDLAQVVEEAHRARRSSEAAASQICEGRGTSVTGTPEIESPRLAAYGRALRRISGDVDMDGGTIRVGCVRHELDL